MGWKFYKFANYVKLLYNIFTQTYFLSQLAIFHKNIIKEELLWQHVLEVFFATILSGLSMKKNVKSR